MNEQHEEYSYPQPITTDAELAELVKLPNFYEFQILHFNGANVTDEGLVHLAQVKALKHLSLTKTSNIFQN